MTQGRWFDRKFELGLGGDAAAELLERLRLTPEQLADAVRGLPPEVLTRKREGKWSIQENAGHLFDLESLWDLRLDDYDAGATELHAADLENRKTHEAAHNDRPISDILADFSAVRGRIVARLARMTPADLARTALHPRLRQPMSVVDLCFFVAEHDDHHLRTIDELRSVFAAR
ncbi:MAG TPA: DinB family protein [Chthoniobacterales bacterium]|nr:DinB family protein [Chthoniobacterales bacterium]